MAIFRPDLVTATPTRGDDFLIGSQAGEAINGLRGADWIFGLSGDDGLSGGENDDALFGGTGADRLAGGSGDDELDGDDGNDILNGGGDDDVLDGGGEDDTLTGGSGVDMLWGGAGDDTFMWNAGDGPDRFDGGSDNDTLQVTGFSAARNLFRLTSEEGSPVLELSERTDSPPFPQDVRLDEISSVETIVVRGGDLDDQFSIGPFAGTDVVSVRFEGGDGRDVLFGSGSFLNGTNEAPVEAFGEAGNDVLLGGRVNDILDGGADDDRLDGEVGDDTLLGGDGNDTLLGGFNGADTLDGGLGSDQLIGGGRDDPDTFRFTAVSGQGTDTIQDFEITDRIELSGVTSDQLDSNADGVLDNADDAVFVSGGSLSINFSFPLQGNLQVSGYGGAAVDALTIGDDVFFV